MKVKMLTTEEKENIAIMTAQGLTPNAIGNVLHRDRKTVVAALQSPEMIVKVDRKREELADVYEDLARRMIGSITDDDITKINAYQRTIAASAATDKMRLCRNQSTSNHFILQAAVEAACENN